MSRRAAKVDSNQADVVDALRAAGCSVTSTAAVGAGFPDLVVSFGGPSGHVVLIEVKDGSLPPSERALTPAQKKWHRETLGPAHVVCSVEEALSVVEWYRKGRKAA